MAGFAVLFASQQYQRFLETPLSLPVEAYVFQIESGASGSTIIKHLARSGFTRNSWQWRLLMRLEPPAIKAGARLIVIDPVETHWAKRADHWLRIRPATDGALALGFLHVLLEAGLFDLDFAARWTNAPFLVREDSGDLFLQDEEDGETGFRVWDGEKEKAVRPDECTRPALTG
ncbi:MAG: molybdopterin-dependent oxidoreductase, partial [Proteobacteria bacterium]|nr:molybdopterin-dependent oxidoreductase [Pseudomonadota bacterium]